MNKEDKCVKSKAVFQCKAPAQQSSTEISRFISNMKKICFRRVYSLGTKTVIEQEEKTPRPLEVCSVRVSMRVFLYETSSREKNI